MTACPFEVESPAACTHVSYDTVGMAAAVRDCLFCGHREVGMFRYESTAMYDQLLCN